MAQNVLGDATCTILISPNNINNLLAHRISLGLSLKTTTLCAMAKAGSFLGTTMSKIKFFWGPMWKKSKFLRTSRAFQNFCRGHCSPLGPQVPPHPGGVRCDAWWGNEDGLISKSSIRLATWDHPMAIEWPRVHSCMMQTMCMMIDKPGSLYVRVEYQVISSMTVRFWLRKKQRCTQTRGPETKESR